MAGDSVKSEEILAGDLLKGVVAVDSAELVEVVGEDLVKSAASDWEVVGESLNSEEVAVDSAKAEGLAEDQVKAEALWAVAVQVLEEAVLGKAHTK